jgi:hypothetical protein
MNRNKMKNKILDYIRNNDNTSYVEIERIFEEEGFSWQGDLINVSDANSNILFWSGWSQEAFDILKELLDKDLIEREAVPPLVYLIDGKSLDMPIVKNGTNYKTPHWLPLAFNAVEGGTAS